MADFQDIRRGLAANLAVLRDAGFQITPYVLDAPLGPTIEIAGIELAEYDIAFRDSSGYNATGDQLTVIVTATIPYKVDILTQQRMDALHSATGLKHAIEADDRLTARMQDDGSLLADQNPACDALRVARYRGQARTMIEQHSGGLDVLIGTWEVDVIT